MLSGKRPEEKGGQRWKKVDKGEKRKKIKERKKDLQQCEGNIKIRIKGGRKY